MDTRPGIGTIDGRDTGIGLRQAGSTPYELQIAGRAGVPASATTAVLNLTATEATGTGFVTTWPCGEPRPNASSLNFTGGRPVANAVIARIGADGKVCLAVSDASANLIVDVNGTLPQSSGYVGVTPTRLLDSWTPGGTIDGAGSAIGVQPAGSTYALQVVGRTGVGSAGAVVLNLTATDASGTGFVTVYPCGASRPNNSNLNFTTGWPSANAVVTELGVDGRVCLYTSDASTHLVADLSGTFALSSGFQPL